jgi:uncharacterized membrane protein HdeD (DUF308 family)
LEIQEGGFIMDREEILKRSRDEYSGRDEMEKDTLVKAGQLAFTVGGLACALVLILEAIFADHVNPATWFVYLSMTGTNLMVKYVKMRKKHELVFGILQLALALVFLVMFILKLVR